MHDKCIASQRSRKRERKKKKKEEEGEDGKRSDVSGGMEREIGKEIEITRRDGILLDEKMGRERKGEKERERREKKKKGREREGWNGNVSVFALR